MTELDCWLWLTLKEHSTPGKIMKLLDVFETPGQIFKAGRKELTEKYGLDQETIEALSDKDMEPVRKVKECCRASGIKILTFDSALYPEKLRQIPDPPFVLYVRSKERINLNDRLCIAMVGNRRMTEYGRCAASDIAGGLASAGVVVVSGLARGIDGAAHAGALQAGGTTVAVLGCGPDVIYPPEHKDMMSAVIETGMVLSEYPPGTPPLPQNFPSRNRIISGLSDGVVVVEAPEKSGALITADCAIKQNRDVFAVPGDITRGHSRGSNNLIREGAVLVASYLDILAEYQDLYINTLKQSINNAEETIQAETAEAETVETAAPVQAVTEPVQDERYAGLSKAAQTIVARLSLTPVSLEQLLDQTGLDPGELSAELMMLEIKGFVKTLPGKHFILDV